LTTPRARTSRRRCAAVTSVQISVPKGDPGTSRPVPRMVAPGPDPPVMGRDPCQARRAISSGT
jgi:hypothetical protein